MSNREPERAPKTYDSQANFRWTNKKIPYSFCTFETKTENFQLSAVRKKIFPPTKGKQQALVLKFATVTSAAAQFKFLAWKWRRMNLIVFRSKGENQ